MPETPATEGGLSHRLSQAFVGKTYIAIDNKPAAAALAGLADARAMEVLRGGWDAGAASGRRLEGLEFVAQREAHRLAATQVNHAGVPGAVVRARVAPQVDHTL